MTKFINTLFPFSDYLYMFQIFEYDLAEYIKWILKNAFARNLQKKHSLKITSKALALSFLSFFLMFLLAGLVTNHLFSDFNLILFLILAIILGQVAPLFILISQLILWPFESYKKQQIISRARNKLDRLSDLKIVAITGSYAKTSTKNILYTLLWKKFRVVKTPKSYNNPLSIAATVFEDLKNNTEIFIAEVGAYKRGEIKKVGNFLQPDFGMITAVAPQHLERFGSIENIALAKFELIESLSKAGLGFLNDESELLQNLKDKAPAKVISFGTEQADFFASEIKINLQGTDFILNAPSGKEKISIPLIGEQHAKNFAAAAALAFNLGLSLREIANRANWLLPTPHRLEIRKQGNMTIIDNSYNTNPDSAKISFKLLKEYPGSQKIIITPGLIELGKESANQNKLFAQEAAGVADFIIIVGEYAKKDLQRGLKEANYSENKILFAVSTGMAFNLLAGITKSDAVVLIENDLPDQYN